MPCGTAVQAVQTVQAISFVIANFQFYIVLNELLASAEPSETGTLKHFQPALFPYLVKDQVHAQIIT